jgi:protein-S-isoprenylcysteine O-methyltransferase Ste14
MVLLKTLIFTVIAPGAVTVLGPSLILSPNPGASLASVGAIRLFGLIPIAIGAAFYFMCAWDFAFAGKGTPAPVDPPKELVVKGIYRFVRNPMYVGVSLILLGEALLFGAPALLLYAAVVGVGFHLFVVFYEEPTLGRRFGESYQRYCARTPRWIPRARATS